MIKALGTRICVTPQPGIMAEYLGGGGELQGRSPKKHFGGIRLGVRGDVSAS